jgi:hypothetical protein
MSSYNVGEVVANAVARNWHAYAESLERRLAGLNEESKRRIAVLERALNALHANYVDECSQSKSLLARGDGYMKQVDELRRRVADLEQSAERPQPAADSLAGRAEMEVHEGDCEWKQPVGRPAWIKKAAKRIADMCYWADDDDIPEIISGEAGRAGVLRDHEAMEAMRKYGIEIRPSFASCVEVVGWNWCYHDKAGLSHWSQTSALCDPAEAALAAARAAEGD